MSGLATGPREGPQVHLERITKTRRAMRGEKNLEDRGIEHLTFRKLDMIF